MPKNGIGPLLRKCQFFIWAFYLQKSRTEELSLPVTSAPLRALLRFLYTDEPTPDPNQDLDSDFLSSLLVLADQLFATRLKEACEVALARRHVALRSAVSLLRFARAYHAPQLQRHCQEFICTHLDAVLESRQLEALSAHDSGLLEELTDFYCRWKAAMGFRVVTPYSSAPCDETVQLVHRSQPVGLQERSLAVEKVKKRGKRRASGRTSSAGDVELHGESSQQLEQQLPILERLRGQQEQQSQEVQGIQELRQSGIRNRLQVLDVAARERVSSEGDSFTSLTALRLRADADFPDLGASSVGAGVYSRSPGKAGERGRIPRISQKERKRLLSGESVAKEGADAGKAGEF